MRQKVQRIGYSLPQVGWNSVLKTSCSQPCDYLIVGAHVDDAYVRRIIYHEYIDLARLLPHDHIANQEDNRMELLNRNGMSYWVPVADREPSGTISNYHKWDLAFRVYSKIYTAQYPHKAGELIQYAHVIYTASMTYMWENIYMYDKDFRLYISRYPLRSWSVILQQAWNLRLKDRLRYEGLGDRGRQKSKEAYRHFNKGKCKYGINCRYEHCCTYSPCGKSGHGAHICTKRLGKEGKDKGTSRETPGNTHGESSH